MKHLLFALLLSGCGQYETYPVVQTVRTRPGEKQVEAYRKAWQRWLQLLPVQRQEGWRRVVALMEKMNTGEADDPNRPD